CCRKCFLDKMIAGNECWIDGTHSRRSWLARSLPIVGQAFAPSVGPIVKGGRIGEQAADGRIAIDAGCSIGQSAEGQCAICRVARHAVENVLTECHSGLLVCTYDESEPERHGIGRLETSGKCAEGPIGCLDGRVLILSKKPQQRLCQTG